MRAPSLVAADGGAGPALDAGHVPEAVIGDLDSLTADNMARLGPERIHEISEQDSTDFDKALRSIDAPLVLAVGFTGGRLDHELGVLSSLLERSDRTCIVIGPETLVFHCPPRLRLTLQAGALVSLFPLRPVTMGCSGLQWSFDALDLAPGARIGTSNAAVGGSCEITASSEGLLVILRSEDLDAAITALGAD